MTAPTRRDAAGSSTTYARQRRRAGRGLMIGFDGTTVTAELREVVREIQPSGFILFARNVVGPAQVRDLNADLAALLPRDRPPLLAVDQEGGRVQRIREPATRFPTLRLVGATDRAEQIAEALGTELRAMGFNLNFAPVADVDSNPDNPVIGDRSFGPDPARVSRQVAAFVRGLQRVGVLGCAKHFPGHGDTRVDSHLDLPYIERDVASLRAVELPPFAAAVRAGIASIMTAHVVFSALNSDWPATLAPRLLLDLIRRDLRFDGLIFTDDLEMKAVADRYPLPEQVRRTYKGSVDVRLACHRPELQLALFEEAIRLQAFDPAYTALAARSERRLDGVVARLRALPPPPSLSVVGSDAHRDLVAQVEAESSRSVG